MPSDPEHQPGWVPDPGYDRMMEEANPHWCLAHDCWKNECAGLHPTKEEA
jgi:hypothetical protein